MLFSSSGYTSSLGSSHSQQAFSDKSFHLHGFLTLKCGAMNILLHRREDLEDVVYPFFPVSEDGGGLNSFQLFL